MLTRAYVEAIDYASQRLKVRIPIFDNVESAPQFASFDDLSWASILAIPGIEVNYNVGDVVIVGFEDHDAARPVVLGYLKSAITDNQALCDVNFNSINTEKLITANDINLGDVSYNDLMNLKQTEE